MQHKVERYLVVDLEGTCCDDGSIPDDERETIEIGAVLLDERCTEEDTFHIFVKPIRHPVLTRFCTALTGIQQSDVDNAGEFPSAFAKFINWQASMKETKFCSWGSYDNEQFRRDCEFHQMGFPLSPHLDVAKLFKSKTGRKRGRRGAMRLLNLVPHGTNHQALADATDVVQILRELLCNTSTSR